ncbi:RYamide neuropeptides-like [Spodoptera litura]|uniref:RYamide neuropeptides-like n=1 Tax=Spodoptera litura TaxID=69820 RepID=A0A9J7DWM9_SPOLT|nr:RYamide neuropeptides-like [Spodoptera litura]XP_022817119.1 RYamide neuropeptides-like [Spodoptera litura]
MCVRARACVCACALLLALVLAEHDKRAEMSPMPFLMATRYGRSSPPARHLAPRNDRFFMSTRYGKRSDSSGGAGGGALGGGALDGGAAQALVCEYTGVWSLYRCRHKPPLYHKRSAEETMERYDE